MNTNLLRTLCLFACAPALVGCGDDATGDNPPPPGANACVDICAYTETASTTEANCTSDAVDALGYDTSIPSCQQLAAAYASGSATSAMCRACYRDIGITDAHCAATERMCVMRTTGDAGGPPPPPPPIDSGTPPPPPVDSGTPPPVDSGTPPGEVNNCVDVCAQTPTASTAEAACVTDGVEDLGYDTDTLACDIFHAAFVTGAATPAMCDACYGSIAITDAHCVQVYGVCR